jgi:hypothetical protein
VSLTPGSIARLLVVTGALILRVDSVVAQDFPQVVTEQTRSDTESLARLQTPGVLIFADSADTVAGFDSYLEVRGRADGRARVATDGAAHRGAGAYEFVAPENGGHESGSGATLYFGPEGYDTVYFRRYLRFAPDYDQGNLNHTGGGLAGTAGSDPWAGMGQAGIRPTGADRFTASLEAWKDWGRYPAPGYFFIYAYWMDMAQDPDGNYWGNFFQPETERRLVPERGRWYCLEQMIAVNDPGQANGEMAAWIDGELHIHATGFRWRTTTDVRLKRASFGIYIHAATRDNRVWYDDIALSTGYIGPVAPEGSDPGSVISETTWGKLKTP